MSGNMKKNTKSEKKEEAPASSGVIIRRRRSEPSEDASTSLQDVKGEESASFGETAEVVTNDVKVNEKASVKKEGKPKKVPEKGSEKTIEKSSVKSSEKPAKSGTKEKTPETAEPKETQDTKKSKKSNSVNAPASETTVETAKSTDKNTGKTVTKSTDKDAPKTEAKPKKVAKKVNDAPARIVKPVAQADAQIERDAQSEKPAKADVTQNKSSAKDEEAQVKLDNKVKSSSAEQEKPKKSVVDKKTGTNDVLAKSGKDTQKDHAKDKHTEAKFAPEASAKPDIDSAKSILPPAGEKVTRVDHGASVAQNANEGASEGQVRVISRPDAKTARVIEKAEPYQRPDNARNDSNNFRRNDARPGAGARPGQGANRPAGNRPPRQDGRPDSRPDNRGGGNFAGRDGARPPFDKDKDAQPRNARPARPAGARPSTPRPSGDMPFGAAMPMDNDQSRKKRNKGRRTVEFGQTESNDTFRRRNMMSTGMDDDDTFRHRRSRKPKKQQQVVQSTQPMKAAKRKIRVEEAIRVADIAHQMSVKSSEIIKALFNLGVMATINNALDIDTATLIASEFGYEVEKVGFSEDSYLVVTDEEKSLENQTPRPPVVTIMGHVDHGKTSLLDAIRKTSVTTGEAGGITQHIGAYHVSTKRGDIVFLDTPGHEAFTAMRARGAQVTDLVVLVVAADDGVMEQTREAVNHSKAAGVPILVAVNKIDKEGANPDRVLRELAELGLQAEDWGGDTVVGYVSAKTGEGLDDLLELIALQAEIMELTANKDKAARGHVVEAKLDKGRGPVATVLIQEGTLHQGDVFVCGVFAGRVRAFFNDQGKKVKEAGPSIPVEIQGFDGVPEAGEEFICLTDEKAARRIAEARAIKQRERELAKASRVTLETFLASTPTDTEAQVLNLVLKADVQGSLEAITDALHKLSTEKVRISVIHSGAGAITETDIMLAAASHGIIIGFNVRPTAKVKEVAEREMVDIRFYDIIYKLVEEIRGAMTGMLAPVSREVYLGQAEVRQPFSVPKVGVIAGSMVNDGKIQRNAGVRLLRDGIVVYTGKVLSLRRLKDDVKEVSKGFECGIGLENYNDIKEGDVIECFEMVEEAASL